MILLRRWLLAPPVAPGDDDDEEAMEARFKLFLLPRCSSHKMQATVFGSLSKPHTPQGQCDTTASEEEEEGGGGKDLLFRSPRISGKGEEWLRESIERLEKGVGFS